MKAVVVMSINISKYKIKFGLSVLMANLPKVRGAKLNGIRCLYTMID